MKTGRLEDMEALEGIEGRLKPLKNGKIKRSLTVSGFLLFTLYSSPFPLYPLLLTLHSLLFTAGEVSG
ncbi:MAG: hypothetical protein COT17_06325 [Elusimicrobia bacterium CG08_land_8_20_14_0_20_51_18]|nr:MAG: hypothetical protein COT17_06325 [Elusimicrobia bacterium CG08_land_8_20_14_0_20_51_18]